MLHDELDFLGHVRRVERHPGGQGAFRGLAVHALLVDHLLAEIECGLVGHIALQDIEDESLIDGLTHLVFVERHRQVIVGRRPGRIGRATKEHHGRMLRRCGEGKV